MRSLLSHFSISHDCSDIARYDTNDLKEITARGTTYILNSR